MMSKLPYIVKCWTRAVMPALEGSLTGTRDDGGNGCPGGTVLVVSGWSLNSRMSGPWPHQLVILNCNVSHE